MVQEIVKIPREMDFSREETIEVLANMGVELPSDTKLPPDALNSRLDRAIELAQAPFKLKHEASSDMNPTTLKKWSSTAIGKKRLEGAVSKMNWKEAVILQSHAQATAPGRDYDEVSTPPAFINAFMDLRNAMNVLAESWGEGLSLAVLEDEDGIHGFTMRIVDIYALTDDIPVFLVVYEHGPGNVFTRPSAKNFLPKPTLRTILGDEHTGVNIPTTFLAQKLLLKVLEMNSEFLDTTFKPTKRDCEAKYKLSFLVPVLPLDMLDVASLSRDTGCAVCGDPMQKKCAACHSVSYCGKECQIADWGTHKRVCKSLAGGKWISVSVSLTACAGMDSSTISALSIIGEPIVKKDDTKSAKRLPPNIHGDSVFIVKIQVPKGSLRPPSLIYDRRRSFEFHLKNDVDPESYNSLRTIARESGCLGQKIYRFARRTGDQTLSICLDREPPSELVKW